MKRIIWIILDSVGMGEMPDADKFGDVGSNTIANVSKKVGGLNIPNLVQLGLGNIEGMKEIEKIDNPLGCYGRFAEMSNGKDTVTGHWEMAGIYSKKPFPTYPNGFPKEIIDAFEKAIGTKILGNKPASGTVILDELGEEHIKTGYPIVYTSADSVFQIAAHEEIIPIERLYEICSIARKILTGDHAVARVIARPFIGKKAGEFTRTPNRRDYAIKPPHDTILDKVKAKGLDVIAVGKIEDIFSGRGITEAIHTTDNMDGVDKTIEYMKQNNEGIIFTNLVDFDMKWGHRNNYRAYAKGLEDFDKRLLEILNTMKDTDVLMINADHGCDPTTPSTDHSREYVPFIAYGKGLKQNIDLKTRKSFADIGQTIGEILGTEKIKHGISFAKDILR
ncbi:phosphopentomutase [Defluviitalea phaphyphila]|uniref:phosphopentomutase n=1 Tax=Defluviitalea phaphyphila TaxID=1473580 RepID=UPI002FE54FBD